MSYPTPHNEASPKDFAKTVLMPGDPLRAKFVAETYLTDPKLVNNVRGIQGYTGLYKGQAVSVMGSGMGMPSIGIYSYELFAFYGVENILRIGSAGGISEKVKLRELVFGLGSCTDSNYASQYRLPGSFAPTASWELLSAAVKEADRLGVSYHVGNLLSSDLFYGDDPEATLSWGKMGVLAVEMESAALYMNAARLGKRALAICTVSDHLKTGEAVSAEDRRSTFTQMMEVALNTALAMA
jgi:purine-nucleoside phosphorylase